MANKTVGAAIAVIGACLMLGASPAQSVCDQGETFAVMVGGARAGDSNPEDEELNHRGAEAQRKKEV